MVLACVIGVDCEAIGVDGEAIGDDAEGIGIDGEGTGVDCRGMEVDGEAIDRIDAEGIGTPGGRGKGWTLT